MDAYKIDFADGSRVLVDANSSTEAMFLAAQIAIDNGHSLGDAGATLVSCELLD